MSSVEEGCGKLVATVTCAVKNTVYAGYEASVLHTTRGAYVNGEVGASLTDSTHYRHTSYLPIQEIKESYSNIAYPYKGRYTQENCGENDTKDYVYNDSSGGNY